MIIELYDYVQINKNKTKKISKKTYIAEKEFYHIENELPNLYRKENYITYNIK